MKQFFEDHEITTIFTKSEMRKILTLCTKNVRFSFDNHVHIEIDGVAKDSLVTEKIFLLLNLRLP